MRVLKSLAALLAFTAIAFTAIAFTAGHAAAQSETNLNALRGLAPVSVLGETEAGKDALATNFRITGNIQNGRAHQLTLLPFHQQQLQALRDAFITSGNADDLADGLGSRLGGIYQTATSYTSPDDGKTSHFTNISPAIGDLITFASLTAGADATSGKYFFANETTDSKTAVSPEAMAILNTIQGATDIFGKAYARPGGNIGADLYGNSRPFQTEPRLTLIKGKDYWGAQSSNIFYLSGPIQDLTNSPSYPSGHTTYGYTEALTLAVLVPERYPQMIARASEYGNDRIILGAHYAMDVLAGRTLALYDLAQLLANKPGYVGIRRGSVQIDDFQKAVADARADLAKALEAECHKPIAECARQDHSRFASSEKVRAAYEMTQTYGLPIVYQKTAKSTEDVAALAPEAGYLLTIAFPSLSLAEADAILTETEGPGGGFLDNGSAFGVYSRLDLYRASVRAMAMAPKGQGFVAR